MSTKITPTIGRVVWFYPTATASPLGFANAADGQPLAAIVARVWNDRCVNLAVFDANGVSHAFTSVLLIQEDEERPDGYFAEWMPYQKQQAEKHASEVARGDEPKVAAMTQCAGQVLGTSARDDSIARIQALEAALRTPGLCHHHDVLKAAEAYQAHIAGKAAPSARELAMEELLRSACAIAERKGADTAWERFANSIRELGLNGVTARTYRVLPSDVE